jgi:hypothetical protein
MLTEDNPTGTQLFNTSVDINGKKMIFTLYINNIETHNGAFMVVPFPLTSLEDIALIDASTDNIKSFIKNVKNFCDRSKSKSLSLSSISNGSYGILEVYNVGNYKISIAMDLNQLLKNIDWRIFQKPNDFESRISVFSNKNIYPFECMYVVAQTHQNIQNDGFGIIYKNPGFMYFPTAHEHHEYEQGQLYDVECYNLRHNSQKFFSHKKYTNFNKYNQYSIIDHNKYGENNYYNMNKINSLLEKINCKFLSNSPNINNIKVTKINEIDKIKINGRFENSNIIYINC